MANWYDFGTATVGAGGTTVTLSAGALALQNIRVGDGFVIKGSSFPPVEILTVPTNLTFTIDAWPYAAQTSVAYTIQPGPAWSSTAAVAQDVSEYLAAISGVLNSDTTNTIGTGSKTWNIQPNARLAVGARVRFSDIAAPSTNWAEGVVTAYAGRALTVLVDLIGGSGTKALWNCNLAGATGATGEQGIQGPSVSDGDKGDIVVSGSGSAFTFDTAVVSTFARTFLDDTSAAAVRTTILSSSYENGASGLAANNLIVNGAMEVSDEWAFGSGTTSNAFYAEQWRSDWSISTGIITGQAAIPGSLPGFNRYTGLTATTGITIASGGYVYISQPLLGQRMQRLRFGAGYAKSVKIGFWLFSTATGVASVGIRRAGNTHAYVTSITIAAANNWVWYTVTVPGETAQSWVSDNTQWGQFFVTAAAGNGWYATPNTWVAGSGIAVAAQSNLLATTGNLVALTGVVMLPVDIEMPPSAAAYLAQPNVYTARDECRQFYERVPFSRVHGTMFTTGTALVNAHFITRKRGSGAAVSLVNTNGGLLHNGTSVLSGTMTIAASTVSADSVYAQINGLAGGTVGNAVVGFGSAADMFAIDNRL